jgi:hypothetical protein
VTSYTFAAWQRTGAAASLAEPDDLVRTAPVRGALNATATVAGGAAQQVPLHVYGPGDVLAFDPRQIVRVFPLPGTPDAETTKFPLVEFARNDLPWLFTPLAPGPTGALRPWLALVCVPAALRPRGEPGRPLPVLRVPASELPDPAFLHLWAHVQMITGDEADPRRSISRLLAPRRLRPHTDYVACLVPAFDAGRRAGLADEGGDLGPSWSRGADAVLPVYFSWAFSTGEGGDFETLTDRLRARPLPASMGRRPLDVRKPGLFDGPGERTQQMESALRRDDAPPREPWPVDAASARWRDRLATLLDFPGADDGDEDPDVLPPCYGGFHALRRRVEPAAAQWLTALNLDPRWRVAAGLGTRAVQREQEALMASAWTQLADVQAANRFLDLARLARLVGIRLHERHVRPLTADEVLQLAAPLRSRALFGSVTLGSRIQDSALPTAMATTAFRRATRPFGPLSRRVAATTGARGRPDGPPFATVITAVAASALGLAVARRDPDGAVALGVRPELVVAAQRLPAVQQALATSSGSAPAWTDLVTEAIRRAADREVSTAQLTAAPAIPAPILDATFGVHAVPEVLVPARFFTATWLTPQGALLFPSGRAASAGMTALTQDPPTDRAFTGQWSGPWDNRGGAGGSWRGECAGGWTNGAAAGGTWRGVFTGGWEPAGAAGPAGNWRAVFTGTWQSATDRGTWRGVCTGTYDAYELTSDGTFTGTWQSPTARGSWHGSCPGTWDWDASGAAGIWRADCAGRWHLSGGSAPDGEVWAEDRLAGILAAWRPDNGIAVDQIFDRDHLSTHAGGLPAPAVLDLTPTDVRQMVGSAHDRPFLPADAPDVPAREAFPAAEAQHVVVGLTEPAGAVAAVVASRLDRPAGTGDDPLQWAPYFDAPMWRPLAAQSTEWLLAGLEHLPADTATLAVTNSGFVEAYLVGVNHEFARELRWREYPTDQRGTYFATFWGAGADIAPIDRWRLDLPLGSHPPEPPAPPVPERVVLVLRSALLRRYPGATIYAAPLLDTEPDDAHARPPAFRGGLDPDTAFLGFDLTQDDLLASPWCFVIAEQPSEPRFGLDDPPAHAVFGRPYQAPPEVEPPTDADDWDNLDWSHLFDRPEQFEAATYAPGATRPNVALAGLVWGSDAAGTARQCFQQPVRVVLPAARLLVPPSTGPAR